MPFVDVEEAVMVMPFVPSPPLMPRTSMPSDLKSSAMRRSSSFERASRTTP